MMLLLHVPMLHAACRQAAARAEGLTDQAFGYGGHALERSTRSRLAEFLGVF